MLLYIKSVSIKEMDANDTHIHIHTYCTALGTAPLARRLPKLGGMQWRVPGVKYPEYSPSEEKG